MWNRNHAVTLIELLFVIAVIVLLAAIAFPVFARAREKARQAGCASNQRQLWMASVLYAQDYDGYFPPYRNTNPGSDCLHAGGSNSDQADCAPTLLRASLSPYVRANDVWFCPSDPMAQEKSNAWFVNHQISSYVFRFTRTWRYRVTVDGQQAVSNLGASEIRLIWDPILSTVATSHQNWPSGGAHFGGVNICYLDGHVKWYRRQ